MKEAINLIVNETIQCAATIAANKGIEMDSNVFADRFTSTKHEWINKIIEEAKKDAERADLFNQLKSGKISPLVNAAFQVALKHGCVQYAKFLLNVQ